MRFPLPHALILGAVSALYLTGALDFIERPLTDARFSALSRPATGEIVLVAIDPTSLDEIGVWPWPRRHHAEMVDHLMAAEAETVVLDIDLSSRSDPVDDALLATALDRAGEQAVLPVFAQYERRQGAVRAAFVEPLPAFSGRTLLGSANVRPAGDGMIREAAIAEIWHDGTIATLAAHLAAPVPLSLAPFGIDYGILPGSVPRLSYVDVLEGRFDPAAVAGKRVLVGATAIELGDIAPTPVWRALPGPIIQILAAETILQNRALIEVRYWVPLALAALSLWLILGPGRKLAWVLRAGLTILFVAGAVLAALVAQAWFALLLPVTPVALSALAGLALSLLREIDEQKLRLLSQGFIIRRQDRILRGVVENMADGLVTIDDEGLVLSFNPAAERIFAARAADVVGHPFAPWLGGGEEVASLDPESPTREAVARRGDGRSAPIEISVSAMAGEEGRARIIQVRDIGDRKATEQALLTAKEEAELANRAKSQFLATMSHELRTPLNAVIGFAEMINQEMMGPVGNEIYLEYSRDIAGSAGHLLNIINDILDISRIEAGKLELMEERLPVAEIAEAAARLSRPAAEERSVTLEIDAPAALPCLLADGRLVKQILTNLLSNAIRFTPEGGRVVLRAGMRPSGGIRLSVSDTGIGIAEEDLPRVVKPFEQASTGHTRQYEGTGLGLPIVRALTDLHGGRFALTSTVGVGTSATVDFPPARTAPAEMERRAAS